jgi:hypothetical protein
LSEADRQVPDRFLDRRSPHCVLGGPLPKGDRRCRQPGLAIVVRDELRAALDGVNEALLQQFRDLAVIMLAGAPQQRLVGGILDQRVLEDVARARRPAALIQQLSLDEAAESIAQARLVDQAGSDEALDALGRPASEKRQGTKSREVGRLYFLPAHVSDS